MAATADVLHAEFADQRDEPCADGCALARTATCPVHREHEGIVKYVFHCAPLADDAERNREQHRRVPRVELADRLDVACCDAREELPLAPATRHLEECFHDGGGLHAENYAHGER